MENCGIW